MSVENVGNINACAYVVAGDKTSLKDKLHFYFFYLKAAIKRARGCQEEIIDETLTGGYNWSRREGFPPKTTLWPWTMFLRLTTTASFITRSNIGYLSTRVWINTNNVWIYGGKKNIYIHILRKKGPKSWTNKTKISTVTRSSRTIYLTMITYFEVRL